jgi:hypothetical protein
MADAPLVMLESGGSESLRADCCGMACNASMVDDCGGAFSPRMLCCVGRRTVGRTIGVKLGPGVGVELADSISQDERVSSGLSLDEAAVEVGVDGRLYLSWERVGEELGLGAPSSIRLRSRTEPGCIDCRRRWPPPPLLTRPLSVKGSGRRLGLAGTRALLSRARSLSAAWADWIALEVPARDVRAWGD